MPEKQNEEQRMADENYKPEYYKGKTTFKKGLASTHEQVSDSYYEGSIDQKLTD